MATPKALRRSARRRLRARRETRRRVPPSAHCTNRPQPRPRHWRPGGTGLASRSSSGFKAGSDGVPVFELSGPSLDLVDPSSYLVTPSGHRVGIRGFQAVDQLPRNAGAFIGIERQGFLENASCVSHGLILSREPGPDHVDRPASGSSPISTLVSHPSTPRFHQPYKGPHSLHPRVSPPARADITPDKHSSQAARAPHSPSVAHCTPAHSCSQANQAISPRYHERLRAA